MKAMGQHFPMVLFDFQCFLKLYLGFAGVNRGYKLIFASESAMHCMKTKEMKMKRSLLWCLGVFSRKDFHPILSLGFLLWNHRPWTAKTPSWFAPHVKESLVYWTNRKPISSVSAQSNTNKHHLDISPEITHTLSEMQTVINSSIWKTKTHKGE